MNSTTIRSPQFAEEGESASLIVDSRWAGLRLDHFLVQSLPGLSRALLIAAVRSGDITVNGLVRKSSYKLKAGDQISGQPRLQDIAVHVEPEEMPLQILFEDEYLLALSKPPGIVVHPGSGNKNGTLVSGLVYHCQAIAAVGDAARPGIVHRLDKDTSGLMLVAKDESVLRKLATDFKNRRVKKEYLAMVHGIMPEKSGRIVAPIGRHPVNRQKMAVQPETGRHAATSWRVIGEAENRYSLLAIVIETGRTHQIRVHMQHIGHPLAGDRVYGGGSRDHRFPRQMLHAARLGFNHPVTAQYVEIVAPLWPDFFVAVKEVFGKIPSQLGEFI
jgi:23S rRNA pseudouridine1911/1915/1917 synthase